uniref:Tc1-like transposase DDE domain-containing protein n=1 Tax=Caenorhabditis japonica TaxID=281687 RepID=A0A8R1EIW8_CAEJA
MGRRAIVLKDTVPKDTVLKFSILRIVAGPQFGQKVAARTPRSAPSTTTETTNIVFFVKDLAWSREASEVLRSLDAFKFRLRRHFAGGPFILQQDWAPSHGSRSTLAVLEAHFPGFLDKNLWPASSPDLNPMDFSVWGMLEGKIAGKVFATVDDLKAALEVAWASIDDGYLRRTVNSVKKRLRACVKARGSNFEILL